MRQMTESKWARRAQDIAGGAEEGRRLARALNDSGVVIVLGDAVFLRPDMIAKAIENMIPATAHATRAASVVVEVRKKRGEEEEEEEELRAMEEEKAGIDAAAV
uniref:Uncharacterized protein n=1 Tax=Oryza meridionalis TaxID=40149 RepID=A0A0E0EEC3_9ORYZ